MYDYITIPVFLTGLVYSAYNNNWTNIVAAVVVFAVFMVFALKGGIAGGDVKFTTALAVWFGYPAILYVLLLGSILAVVFGLFNYQRLGVLRERVIVFVKGLFFKLIYKVNITPAKQLPEEGICEEAVPFGTFMVIAAWVIYFMGVI
ncbi:MAG: prepilin peptidase [Syntrophomonadaceae bacterium]|nr:prepilin peptidase [Syntrophomonadaceae bacterium]